MSDFSFLNFNIMCIVLEYSFTYALYVWVVISILLIILMISNNYMFKNYTIIPCYSFKDVLYTIKDVGIGILKVFPFIFIVALMLYYAFKFIQWLI